MGLPRNFSGGSASRILANLSMLVAEYHARGGKDVTMQQQKYVCTVCGWIYDPAKGDPDNGVKPGTPWEEVPEDWVCPDCGVPKDDFEPTD